MKLLTQTVFLLIATCLMVTGQTMLTNSGTYTVCFSNELANPATVQITLQPITNWTGVNLNNVQELGYVATNHNATVIYQGLTNQYTLKCVPSDIAVWRTNQIMMLMTNIGVGGYYTLPNYIVPGYQATPYNLHGL